MLVTSNVTMQFGSKPLFENISVKFGGGNRYGLIGANGSGKSTFMKILGGDLEPTLGNVSLDPNERIGKLRQDQFAFEEFTVLDTVIMGHAELWEVKQERDRIYALAEIAWSPVERKSWREFSEVRLPAHLARIDASGEPYRLPAPLGIEDGTSEGESFSFVIRPPFPGCKVRYTLNGAVPQDFDREMPEKFDIAVPRGEQRTLRCVTIAPSGRRSTVTTLVLTNRMQTNNPE